MNPQYFILLIILHQFKATKPTATQTSCYLLLQSLYEQIVVSPHMLKHLEAISLLEGETRKEIPKILHVGENSVPD